MYPVPLRRSAGTVNAYLEIFLYRNQLQLAAINALYSDGDRYLPAVAALDSLKSFLPSVNNVLILGAGLGSMIRAMRKKGCYPGFTLVDIDKKVLEWAIEFLDDERVSSIEPKCMDAQLFMVENTTKYDLVFIDIFNGRVVPPFVSTTVFLQQCRDSVKEGGHLAFNYIINDDHEWEKVRNICTLLFPGHKILSYGINRIIVI